MFADARAGGKRILRLKVVLEERGWALTPGAMPTAPRATGDRLEALHQLDLPAIWWTLD
jgi:hypothetical protein